MPSLQHPQIRAISFVGSSPVARYIYSQAAAHGKRVQCQGGAKNPIIVLPDADLDMTTRIAADSAFGCAGQRCLAASLAITVGEAREPFTAAIAETAANRVTGNGLEAEVQMGPVITAQSRDRIESLIQQGADEGAKVLVDGRQPQIAGLEQGYFIKPTILQDVSPDGEIARTEIFGPVLGLMHVETVDAAIAWSIAVPGVTWPACLPVAVPPLASFAPRPKRAISASISGSLRPWRFFPLAAGRTASLAICMGKVTMPSSFLLKLKSSLSAGPKRGAANSDPWRGHWPGRQRVPS
jgi:hypothetical protein